MIPPDQLNKTPVFHMTHVENLVKILSEGALLATNLAKEKTQVSIASEEVQSRRASRLVTEPPGGSLHDYVPFYFAPRAPMLYCNHVGNITNARPQGEIIYLVGIAQEIERDCSCVFYDRHAVLGHAICSNQLSALDQIDWRIFFEPPLVGGYSKYWQDRYEKLQPHWSSRREVRQAEFLVHERLEIDLIQLIAVQNEETANRVNAALQSSERKITVEIKPEWYF